MSARVVAWIRANPVLVAAIAAGLIARVVLWAWTGRVIDDAYITIKHAKNLVDGLGLTHHLGEEGPVHGFTSALSVLIPIPGEAIGSGGGLIVLRLTSLAAFVAAVVFAARICGRLELGTWPTGLVLAYLALDQNQIFYGVAGMETQIATAVLLAGVYYVLVDDFVRAGVLLGLAPLARPDFIVWVAPAYVYLLIRDRDRALKAGLIAAAIILPWLAFTMLYYGSPVPNTIIAKSQAFGPDFPALTDPGAWGGYIVDPLLTTTKEYFNQLGPFIERNYVTATPLPRTVWEVVGWTVATLAVVGAGATWRRPAMRPAIVAVGLWSAYRIAFVGDGYFEWYGVPIIAVIMILAAAGLQRLLGSRPAPLAAAAAAVALLYAVHIPFTYPLEARVQHEIEDPVRDQVGRYLGEVTRVGETMTAEPAGYVAFYTNATLLDFPGLTSTTVTDALAEPENETSARSGNGVAGLVGLFAPDWLILRPTEWAYASALYPRTAARYALAREFRADGVSKSQGGLTVTNADDAFLVLRRVR